MARRPNIKITKLAQFEGHKDSIYDFVIDRKANTLYSACAGGFIVRWDINQPDKGTLVLQSDEAFYSIALIDGVLKAGSRSGAVYSVDLSNKRLLSTKQEHTGGVFFIKSFGSGGQDGILRVADSKSFELSKDSLRCSAESSADYFIGSSDNTIYQMDKQTYEVKQVLKGHTNSVFSLAMIDDTTLVSIGRDAMLRAWDLTIGKEVHAVPAHEYQAKSLSYNGNLLLSSSMDKTIKLWDDELNLLKVIDFERYGGHTNCINKLEWLDEKTFISCSDDRSLCLWKVEIMA